MSRLPKIVSEEGILRNRIAASVLLSGLLLAGCSGNSEEPAPAGEASKVEPPPAEAEATRVGAAKSLAIPDQCSIISDAQRQELGLDQAPRARTSNGKAGCQYEAGAVGQPGWGAFVSADPDRTMKQFSDSSPGGTNEDLSGYPAYVVSNGSGCVVAVDASDAGSVFVNTIVRPGADPAKSDACGQAEQVAEVAVTGLPNE